jgi:hypothetical protein
MTSPVHCDWAFSLPTRRRIQLFDLKENPDELNNLAAEPDKYKDTILRMNALLNELMAKQVGRNDGAFLPPAVRPKQSVVFDKH